MRNISLAAFMLRSHSSRVNLTWPEESETTGPMMQLFFLVANSSKTTASPSIGRFVSRSKIVTVSVSGNFMTSSAFRSKGCYSQRSTVWCEFAGPTFYISAVVFLFQSGQVPLHVEEYWIADQSEYPKGEGRQLARLRPSNSTPRWDRSVLLSILRRTAAEVGRRAAKLPPPTQITPAASPAATRTTATPAAR